MVRRIVSLAVSTLFLSGQLAPCIAQEGGAGNSGATEAAHHCHHHETESACHTQPASLDLSSTVASATAGHIAQTPININVGGAAMTVMQSMALTPAQMIATYQVAHSGQQSLLLGADGSAIGGSFTIGSRLAQHISELVIPANVTAFNKATDLNLIGNLTNAGTIQAIASNPNISTINISANNIVNSGLLNSLLNLNLFAVNNIINSGSIISAGSLSMTAGGSIQNIANGGTAALLQAMNALTMQAPQIINQGSIVSQISNAGFITNSLINSGNIQALAGNVNIAALTGNVLDVNNVLGQINARDTISMVTGATVFGETGLVLNKAGINLKGGVLTAQDINLTSPEGQVEIRTERLNGNTIVNAGVANVGVQGGTLNIGLNLTGDPIITNSNGDIVLSTNFNPGTASDYIVLATGNISAGGGFNTITTTGGNVVLSAGYLFVGNDNNCTDCTGLYSISRTVSSTGGSINMSGVIINANGAAGTFGSGGGSGGNVTLQASNDINFGTIGSSGGTGGNGANGIPGGGAGGNGANGGNGGNISVYSGSTITFSSSVSSSAGAGGSGGIGGSGVSFNVNGGNGGAGGSSGNGGAIDIEAIGNISLASLSSSGATGGPGGIGGNGDTNSGGNGGTSGSGGNGGTLTVNSQGSISVGSVTAAGGVGGAGGLGGGSTLAAGGNGGDAGNGANGGIILLNAGGSTTSSSLNTAGGAGGSGGLGGLGNVTGSDGNGGNGGNAGLTTLIAGTTLSTNGTVNATGGIGGTGASSGTNGQAGVVIFEAGATSNAINIGNTSLDVGSLAFITGYGTTTPVLTKVLPISGHAFVTGELDGSGVTVIGTPTFTVRNTITVAQNPNGLLLIDSILNIGGEGIYTLSNGNVSAADSGSIDTRTVAGQDVVIIANTDIGSSGLINIDVASANGNTLGGQIIAVAGLGSSGPFVTESSSYTNPFMILSPGSSSIAVGSASFTTNSNLVYAAAGSSINVGSIETSGQIPTLAGSNGLPGGQIVLASNGSIVFDNTGQSGALFAFGADGANGGSTHLGGGNGGMGGIINIKTANALVLPLGTESSGGTPGSGFGSAADGNAGNGGIITLNVDRLLSSSDICACSGVGANGNGGKIFITTGTNLFDLLIGGDNSDDYLNGILRADSLLSGNGGTIVLNAGGTINIDINATISAVSGSSGGTGGSISLNSGGIILSLQATLDASGNDAGGSIRLTAADSIFSAQDTITTANQLGTPGVGGTIYIAAPNTVNLNSSIGAPGSSYGGRIDILSNGTIENNSAIAASAAAGAGNVGGRIQISTMTPGAGPVTLINNGNITATDISTNTTGRVGINGGTNSITITGSSGGITGGEFVNIGNLNSTTLAIIPPFTVVNNFSGIYNQGNISIAQGGIAGTLQVSGVANTPVAPSAATIAPANFNLALYLFYLAQLQQLALLQNERLYEQLGTRIATDYTPPLNVYNLEFPLQGNIKIDQITGSGQALFAAATFSKDQLNTLATQGIVFGPKSNGTFLDLGKGNVLFMPTEDIQVQTKEGTVSIPKGAIVWIMETGNDAAVYDLHDSMKDPVKVISNGKEMTLSPGTQILMTRDSKGSFESLNPGSAIGTRNVRSKDLGAGIKAYIADFSISGGVMNVGVMRSLLKSDNPEHKKAALKVLKNAAILADLTGGAEPYKANSNH